MSTTNELLKAHKQRMIELLGEQDAAPFIEMVGIVARLTTERDMLRTEVERLREEATIWRQ